MPPLNQDHVDLTAMQSSGAANASANGTQTFTSLFPYSAGLAGVNQHSNFLYIHLLIATFCSLIAFTLFLQISKRTVGALRLSCAAGNPREQRFWAENKTHWWPWLKENLLYAPLWKVRHNREFQLSTAYSMGTLPSRGHTFILVAYLITNIAYCLNVAYDQPVEPTVAELRGRSGSLAAFNLVLTVLFALRNNPLIWILGVPYDTFNLFHRWIARLAIFESILHILFWTGNTVHAGGWHAVREAFSAGTQAASYVNGLVGGVLLCIIAVQAWSPIRHAFYETFLNIHKLAVAGALVTIYFHLDLDSLPQTPWLVLALCLWSLEFLFRIIRILYYNVSLSRAYAPVTIEALPGEACRVTFELARPWRYRPGAHVHIYIPTISWWSSHPFTVAWAGEKRPPVISYPLERLNAEELEKATKPSLQLNSSQTSVSVVCRTRTGFTAQLYAAASSRPTYTFRTWGFVEGPYGSLESLTSYGTVLLFAGGIGITHQLSHLPELLGGAAQGLTATRKVVLVWSVPNTEALEWVRPWMNHVLDMKDRRHVLRVLLFVTKPRRANEVRSASGSIRMFPGRCNVQMIVDDEVDKREGAMAITVCGPGGFADDVRRAARRRVKDGVVDFVEEAFTY